MTMSAPHATLVPLLARLQPIGDRPWHWIDHWVIERPHAVALNDGTTAWSFTEYSAAVRRWHERIATIGTRRSIVALSAPKSLELVAAMIGVMRSGNTVLVIDPDETASRIDAIFAQATPAIVVSDDPALVARAPSTTLAFSDSTAEAPDDLPAVDVADDDLAWLCYSSGSTGVPTGSAKTFANLAMRTAESLDRIAPMEGDVLSQVHALSFSASARAVFGGLASGAQVRLFDPRTASISGMLTAIRDERVTFLHAPPRMVRGLLASCGPDDPRLASVRRVRLGADRTQPGDIRAALRCFPDGCEIVIGYSSSEVGTIAENTFRRGDPIPSERLSVGVPMPWLEIRVVDDDDRPVPSGDEGVLEVLSHGFMPVPYPVEGRPARNRRNGDLARLLEDGSIDLVGRADLRVKVDGVAVDLNEVEGALQNVSSVAAAACVAVERGDRTEVVAFVATASTIDHSTLREGCRDLPEHARPTRFRFVDALPTTPRGKVDRRALRSLALEGCTSR